MVRITRAEKVRQQLAEEIIGGHLPPGTRLDEVEQARRFNVSRTPVREAFRQLTALGLIENRPHRGVVVTPITHELVRDLHQAYAAIGQACIRLAGEACIRLASEACIPSDMQEMEDDDAIVAALHAFGGNSVIKDMGDALWCRLKPYRRGAPGLRPVAEALAMGDDEMALDQLARIMAQSAECAASKITV